MMHQNSVNNLFLNQKVVQVTANYTVQADDVIVEVGAIAAPITITLPAPSPQNKGKYFLIQDGAGIAQTYTILITAPSSTIDGASNHTIVQNYGSAHLFSTGTGYCTYSKKQPKVLAKGAWTGNVDTGTDFTNIKIDKVVTNWTTTLIPVEGSSDPRLDLSRLTLLYLDSDQFKLASDSRSISFASPGLYRILLNSNTFDPNNHLPRTLLTQLIKNNKEIMKACPTCDRAGAGLNALKIFYQGNFAVNDRLDIRFASYREKNFFQILCADFSIQQLPTYAYDSFL